MRYSKSNYRTYEQKSVAFYIKKFLWYFFVSNDKRLQFEYNISTLIISKSDNDIPHRTIAKY